MRGGGGQKMSVFVHGQGIKTVHAGGRGVKKWQNSVHVVVECPLKKKVCILTVISQQSIYQDKIYGTYETLPFKGNMFLSELDFLLSFNPKVPSMSFCLIYFQILSTVKSRVLTRLI